MNVSRLLLCVFLCMSVSACATIGSITNESQTLVSGREDVADDQGVEPSFDVQEISVLAPRSLTISEKNLYYPQADIVWRGELGPNPNRHEQVEAIMRTAAERATEELNGTDPVAVEIELIRFHSLTEKARYSVGGVHNIIFTLAVRDAESDNFIVEPYTVEADLKAYGSDRAIQADLEGQTMKVRITDYLTDVIAAELAKPLPATPEEPLPAPAE